jgi:HEPN domain-containing protein
MYYSSLSYRTQTAVSFCVLAGLILCIAPAAHGQQDKGLQFLPAPPPLKSFTRDERSQLDAARDTKSRLRTTMAMADARLGRAEELASGQQYDAACAQLGSYQGLIENLFSFLNEREPRKHKIRDVYRRLEITLRAQGTRIEAIRRVTPLEHSINIKAILDFAYRARTEALNSFYGGKVVTEVSAADEPVMEDQTSAGTPESPPANQP